MQTAPTMDSSKKQRQLIAIGCSQLGIDADLRHSMLLERFGVESSTKLTTMQAVEFLKELELKGFRIQSKNPRRKLAGTGFKRNRNGRVVALVNQAQKEKMAVLAGLVKWRERDGFILWMKKRMGMDKVRTEGDAFTIIEGLKKVFEHQMKQEFGKDWWLLEYSDPGIKGYIKEHAPSEIRDIIYPRYLYI